MIDKLNHYSFTTPASIHDEEAMTALELAGRVGAKMNETVHAVNDFTEKVNENIANHRTETDEWLQKQDTDIEYMRKTLLPNEVKNEFQRNINNGAFTSAIDEYAGDLKAQVENLTANLEAGSTTMDAEIITARMDQKTQHTYGSLSSSIRNQIEVHTDEDKQLFVENLYNFAKAVDGLYVSSDGLTYGNSSYCTSEYIRVKGGKNIHFSKRADYEVDGHEGYYATTLTVPFVALYDEDKKLLFYYTNVHDYCVVPQNVSFIRFSVNTSVRYDVMCSYFNPYTAYLTRADRLIRPEHNPDFNKVNDSLLNANMIDPAKITEGYYAASTDGLLYANTNNWVTGYIPVSYGKSYSLFNRDMNKVNMRMICVYDRYGDKVNSEENINTFTLWDQGDEPYFIRVSIDNSFLGACMFTHSDATTYTEYGVPVIRESALPSLKVEADVDMSQCNSHLGGAYKRNVGTSLSFPAHLHNFDIVLKGVSDRMSVTVGDMTIAPTTSDDTYDTWVHIHCREGVATVRKVIFNGVTETTVSNVDSGDITCTSATVISATSPDFRCPLWIVGDSYMGSNTDRVYGQLKDMGVNNVLRLSRSGLDSSYAYPELVKALEFGTPKVLIWYVGVNDTDYTVYQTYLSRVGTLCREKGITLILNRVPSLPDKDTSEINSVVTHNIFTDRYIDSYSAVNIDDETWRGGTLSADNVHPTEAGARMLASQMLLDAPELLTYGGDA